MIAISFRIIQFSPFVLVPKEVSRKKKKTDGEEYRDIIRKQEPIEND